MHFGEKGADQPGHLVQRRLQQEMPAVEQMDFGIGQVIGESLRTGRTEYLVAATPHRKQWHLAGAEVLMHTGIQR